MSWTFAVDWDGTVFANGQIQPLAKETLFALHRAGCKLVLFSCRCNPVDPSPTPEVEAQEFYRSGTVPAHVLDQWARFDEMRNTLKTVGLWDIFEIWQEPGKPIVDRYIDDKAEEPDWADIASEFVPMVKSTNASRPQVRPMGSASRLRG